MRTGILKDHIEELIKYLQPLLPLGNFHMVDYFTGKDPLRTFFPCDFINEIEELGIEKTINNIFNNDYNNLVILQKYMNLSSKFTLKNCPNICLNINDFQNSILDINGLDLPHLKMTIFMNSKKSHEVEVLSYLCAQVHHVSKTSHLVDVGDGKGYLSSFLALHHKIPVLGVDAREINSDGAVKRVKKLSKVWNSISSGQKKKETSSELYKQATMFINDNVNIKELVSNIFLSKITDIGLVGLHTCGDLSASCLRLFVANEDIKTICNVGCCYHFITEKFEGEDTNNYGFPLSNLLQSKKLVIGRAARMIAAQSIERILDKKELPNKTLFYRSLYEVLLLEKYPNLKSCEKQVGRFRRECVSFEEYVKKASARLGIEINNTDEELRHLYDKYKNRRQELNLFYLLRGLLVSSAVEGLILLDRLYLLLENGYENSFLVHLFDPVISPRCYGLIAIK